MDFWLLAVKILVLMSVVCVPLILFLRWMLFNSAEGAVKRLNSEAEQARGKQAELSQKIKEADDELAKRRAEADQLSRKMLTDAEEQARQERDKLIVKAREEGEEIITKAQATKERIRKELEKEMYLKSIDYAVQILGSILSEDAKGALSSRLILEFLEGLQKVDMNRIGSDVTTAEMISAAAVEENKKAEISKVIGEKLKRSIQVNFSVDPQLIGGVILKFGSLALDGSLQNRIREAAVISKQKTENE